MAEIALPFIFKQLFSVGKKLLTLSVNKEEELSELQKAYKEMEALMRVASEKQNSDYYFKELMRQMWEVMHDVEDTIDIYSLKPNNIYLQSRIKNLGEKVAGVADKVRKYLSNQANTGGTFHTGTQGTTSTRIKAPREESVVGLEEQTDTLVNYIIKRNKGFDVLSIVGMPGLGKTTLAWKIYRDPRIESEFRRLIWVYFSKYFIMRDVLVTILKKFNIVEISNKSDDELTEQVKDLLKSEKFLIFIDDVWDIDAWKQLDKLFNKGNKDGRVLMTTRYTNVAVAASRPREPHRLEFLSLAKSLELLHIEIYNTTNLIFPPALGNFPNDIATNCGGLPLAIIVIGGMLRANSSSNEWRRISENVSGYISEKDQEENLRKIIDLSYKNLPYNLRDCFLYLGMFPVKTEISALKLTQLWIAEGFTESKTQGESLEETAEDNLKELISTNLVMAGKRKINGEVKTCTVHDTIREFCRKESGVEGKNLFQEISKPKGSSNFVPSDDVVGKSRRLSIHTKQKEFFLKKQKLPILRTCLYTSKETINLEYKDSATIKKDDFELIKILDVSPFTFPLYPINYSRFILLTYLSISGNEFFNCLPEALGKLCHMQTLIVNTSRRTLLTVKANIWDMLKLRHFKTKSTIVFKYSISDERGKGGEHLQTLSRLSTGNCKSALFRKAKNLKTLGICGDLNKVLDLECLENLECLEKLKLLHYNPANMTPLKLFPRRLPVTIKFLTLSATKLNWDQISEVGKLLSKLEGLKLTDNAFVGKAWNAVSGDFEQLDFLYISNAPTLKNWTVSHGSFPKLRRLVLKNCVNLESLPNNLEDNLEVLDMERIAQSLIISARKMEMRKQEAAQGGKFKLTISSTDMISFT